jgi:ABC-type branched-subunit amino acid transport system substrate-binding protein
MTRATARLLAGLLSLTLVAAACSRDDGGGSGGNGDSAAVTTGAPVDYAAVGLWDDGPCDESLPPLVVGTSAVFESPVISLGDQVLALEAAAEAFNARGGANGACIEAHTCDDGANLDQALACVRELDEAGIVATVNEVTTEGNAEVAGALADAGIPRVATNVGPDDWGDPNAFPIDASSTGVAFLMPLGLIQEEVLEIGLLRPDLPQTAALTGLFSDMYADEGATFPMDAAVAPATTDYTQYILAAQEADVGGVVLALGEQEAVQVVRAGEQLATDLQLGASLGTFPHSSIAELGDIAEQMVFLTSFPPATYDLPVYEALRADLAASGDEALQPANLKVSAMRAWIGLYALLQMIREAEMTEFTREGITTLLQEATDVPMLDMFGGEDWTPDLNHEGLFQRAGTNHWGIYRWDPDAEAPAGLEGNFVQVETIVWDEALCDSPFAAPCT